MISLRRFVLGSALLALLTGAVVMAPKPKIRSYKFEAANGETVKAQLGTVTVKENRSKKDSRTIKLKFVRFKSTSKTPGSPIVYLAGGPGGSGIRTARGSRFPLFMALREFGDVIAFDQRGTGMTGFEELDCDDRFTIPYDQPVDRAQAGKIIAEVTKGCTDRLRKSGVDLSAYNTRESAADLNDLRLALGAEKITLWGISYGTHLALATMKYHGEHIDRVILAGLEGLHHSWKLPSDQQALLEEIARRSNADPAVRDSVPDLLASISKLMATLEKEPQTVQLTHPIEGVTAGVAVGKFDLQVLLAGALRGPSLFAMVPEAVARMEQGDFRSLALASAARRTGEGIHGMSVAMDCASGASQEWYERIAREAKTTLLGDAINFPFPEVCQGLEIPDLGDEFRKPVRSDIPALLISGTLDGRTPVSNGDEIMAGLSNAQHLIVDGAGHSDPLFLSSPKILEAMEAFMRGQRSPAERITLPPVEFVAPREIAAIDDLEKYVGSYRITADEARQVINADGILYTRRNGGRPMPILPTSHTEFYYEGSATHLRFEMDDAGAVTGMVVFHDGAAEGEPAKKIK